MTKLKITTLVLTALSISGIVWASTTTNSPGGNCVAASSGSLNVRSDGEAENTTNTTVIAVCPAERPVGANLTTKASGQVFVVDQSVTGDVCCRIESKNPGGAIVTGPLVCSSGTSASYQALTLPEITDAFTYSHFFVWCSVPAINGVLASRIQMYRTTQQ